MNKNFSKNITRVIALIIAIVMAIAILAGPLCTVYAEENVLMVSATESNHAVLPSDTDVAPSDFVSDGEITINTADAFEDYVKSNCTEHNLTTWHSNNDGTMTATCSICGLEVTENCQFADVVVAPTCLTDGYTLHVCSTCGYSYKSDVVETQGHDVAQSVDEATGTIKYYCKNCNYNYSYNPDNFAVQYSDGRKISGKITKKLKKYIASKDKEINEELAEATSTTDGVDVVNCYTTLIDSSKGITVSEYMNSDSSEADDDADTEESSEENTGNESSSDDLQKVDSLSISTDSKTVISYLEALAYSNYDMDISLSGLKSQIDSLYYDWYYYSSQQIEIPNESVYRDSSEYQDDLKTMIANNGGTSPLVSRIVSKAYGEIGNGSSKYINYYNKYLLGNKHRLKSSEPWCSEFVSWVFHTSGLSSSAAPAYMSAHGGVNAFSAIGKAHNSRHRGGSYTPKAGDAIWFSNNGKEATHSGLVVGYSGGTITTVERRNNKVGSRTISASDSRIWAYGEIDYTLNSQTCTLVTLDNQSDWCKKVIKKSKDKAALSFYKTLMNM